MHRRRPNACAARSDDDTRPEKGHPSRQIIPGGGYGLQAPFRAIYVTFRKGDLGQWTSQFSSTSQA